MIPDYCSLDTAGLLGYSVICVITLCDKGPHWTELDCNLAKPIAGLKEVYSTPDAGSSVNKHINQRGEPEQAIQVRHLNWQEQAYFTKHSGSYILSAAIISLVIDHASNNSGQSGKINRANGRLYTEWNCIVIIITNMPLYVRAKHCILPDYSLIPSDTSLPS